MDILLEKILNQDEFYFYELIKKNIDLDIEELKKHENDFKDNEFYCIALAILSKNNYDNALTYLQNCENVISDYFRCHLLYQKKEYQRILNVYSNTKNIKIYYYLIKSSLNLKNYENVISYAIQYLEIFPNSGEIYYYLAQCYYYGNTNNQNYIIRNFGLFKYYSDKAIVENYYHIYEFLGNVYSKKRMFSEDLDIYDINLAIYYYSEGLKYNLPNCSFKLGELYYEIKNYELSLNYFSNYLMNETDENIKKKSHEYIKSIFNYDFNIFSNHLNIFFDLNKKCRTLELENEKLKLEIEYRPGGKGAIAAKNHFNEELKRQLEENYEERNKRQKLDLTQE